jgi:hypothetical protein
MELKNIFEMDFIFLMNFQFIRRSLITLHVINKIYQKLMKIFLYGIKNHFKNFLIMKISMNFLFQLSKDL